MANHLYPCQCAKKIIMKQADKDRRLALMVARVPRTNLTAHGDKVCLEKI